MVFNFFSAQYVFNFSFFAVVCLTLLMTEGNTALVCLLSSFLHELGHLIPLYIYKTPPKKVVFAAFGIRIERTGEETLSYKKEAVVSVGGIVVNCILAFAGVIIWKIKNSESAMVLTLVNIFIAILNSIPVSVLDLGRFLMYILLVHFDEEKVNRIAETVSDVAVAIIVVITVFYTVFSGVSVSMIAVCIYLLILNLQERWK